MVRSRRFSMVGILAAAMLMVSFGVVWAGGSAEQATERYTIRFAIVSGPAHTHNRAIEEWAKKVEAETNGRLRIELLGGGQLGGERDYIEGMELGTIEMAQVSTGPVSGFIPDFTVLSLPFVFDDYDHIARVVTGPAGDKLFERLAERDIVGLTWFTNGFRSVFNRHRPVNAPADLSGMRIRVMESAVMVDTLNQMGAAATPMAYGELYSAIQQGVMDGAENAPGNMLNDQFHEVAGYLSLTQHFAPPGVVAISKRVFDRLPDDLQSYLKSSALELGEYQRDLDRIEQEAAVQRLRELGVQVNDVNREAFRAATAPVIDSFRRQIDPEILRYVLQ